MLPHQLPIDENTCFYQSNHHTQSLSYFIAVYPAVWKIGVSKSGPTVPPPILRPFKLAFHKVWCSPGHCSSSISMTARGMHNILAIRMSFGVQCKKDRTCVRSRRLQRGSPNAVKLIKFNLTTRRHNFIAKKDTFVMVPQFQFLRIHKSIEILDVKISTTVRSGHLKHKFKLASNKFGVLNRAKQCFTSGQRLMFCYAQVRPHVVHLNTSSIYLILYNSSTLLIRSCNGEIWDPSVCSIDSFTVSGNCLIYYHRHHSNIVPFDQNRTVIGFRNAAKNNRLLVRI